MSCTAFHTALHPCCSLVILSFSLPPHHLLAPSLSLYPTTGHFLAAELVTESLSANKMSQGPESMQRAGQMG